MEPPYRNETESLRVENERLRVALRARRRGHVGVTLALVFLSLVALFVLQPWLNAASDVRFWGAVAILVTLGIAAALSAFGYRRAGN
ncbi:MAG TPA: hypothetical protein VNO21_28095 [Polyangiaceae bacterium]|nr:hypothetical protein [Polyangiaceae bacterium]